MKQVLEKFNLSFKSRRILGLGAEGKNRVCLAKGRYACLSGEIGDLKEPHNYNRYKSLLTKFPRQLHIQPEIVAHDFHPLYQSTRLAKQFTQAKLIPVQHHWAHIGSVLVERGINSPVVGLAFDGTGLGLDGHLWGGEILTADLKRMERLGHFKNILLPGGEVAIREPYRLAFSFLYELEGKAFLRRKHPLIKKYSKEAPVIFEILKKKFNSPKSSSVGRLFDAVSALLGLKEKVSFEGEAAIALEKEAEKGLKEAKDKLFSYRIEKKNDCFILNPLPLIEDVLKAQDKKVPKKVIAAVFHLTLAEMSVDVCRRIRRLRKMNRVVLSGGVFQNKILREELQRRLELDNFKAILPEVISVNDSSLALGQVGIANFQARTP